MEVQVISAWLKWYREGFQTPVVCVKKTACFSQLWYLLPDWRILYCEFTSKAPLSFWNGLLQGIACYIFYASTLSQWRI